MCRFVVHVAQEGHSARTVVNCETHHFAMPQPITAGTLMCPIGQIEKVRDEAMERIAAAGLDVVGKLTARNIL